MSFSARSSPMPGTALRTSLAAVFALIRPRSVSPSCTVSRSTNSLNWSVLKTGSSSGFLASSFLGAAGFGDFFAVSGLDLPRLGFALDALSPFLGSGFGFFTSRSWPTFLSSFFSRKARIAFAASSEMPSMAANCVSLAALMSTRG